jgi:3',5'-cyclic AMP phosphodiesterase CpdA
MLPDYLALPGGSFYYSFDHGPAHFTVLDTGEDKEDSNAAYSGLVDFFGYRRQQREWLAKEVRSSAYRNARFRIGIAHVPFPEEPGKWEGVADAHRNFTDLLNASPVDLLLSAHKHQAAVVEPREGRNPYPIVRGGGPTPANRTVIRVNVTPDRLTVTILRPGGEVVGWREVRRR